jgi:signal transduction histidine kinase/CheY-like chemotaxis protein/AraC-like DNA-binding protein
MRYLFVFYFWGLVLVGSVLGQQLVQIKRYSVADGLSNNHVYQTFEDSRGFVWVVTSQGLNFFDGKRFTEVYKWSVLARPDDASIETEDGKGFLWLRIRQRNSVQFLLVELSTQRVIAPEEIWGSLPAGLFDVTRVDSLGLLLIDSMGQGWSKAYQKEAQERFKTGRAGLEFSVSEVASNTIWMTLPMVATGEEYLYLIDWKTGKIITERYFNAKNCFFINSSSDLGWADVDALHLIKGGGQSTFQLPPSVASLCTWDRVVGKDAKSGDWWIFGGNRLVVYNPEINRSYFLSDDLRGVGAFGDVFQIFTDSKHLTWISSINGLYQLNYTASPFHRLLWNDPLKHENPFKNSCRGMLEHSNGNVVVNFGHQIGVVSDGTKNLKQREFQEGPFFGIAEDLDGTILIGGLEGKLFKFSARSGKLERINNVPIEKGNIIWSIFPQREGIWLGFEHGIGYLDRKTGQLMYPHLLQEDSIKMELGLSSIYHIERSMHGESVLMASSSGLFELTSAGQVINWYRKTGLGTSYLPSNEPRHFSIDAYGNYWIASSEGLIKWNTVTGEKQLYNRKNGFPTNNLYAVYPDEVGDLWISSDNGIIHFEQSTGNSRYYLPKDGITHQEFNRIAHLKKRDGSIWFGGLNGISAFSPKEVRSLNISTAPSEVILKAVDGLRQNSIDAVSIMRGYATSGTIEIQDDWSGFLLKFAHSDYHNSELIELKYWIEGIMSDWQIAEDGVVVLANLPQGRYNLYVEKQGGSGFVTTSKISIPLIVKGPVYNRLWFRLLLVLLAISFFLLSWIRQRKSKLVKDQLNSQLTIAKGKQEVNSNGQLNQASDAVGNMENHRFLQQIAKELKLPATVLFDALSTLTSHFDSTADKPELLAVALRNSQVVVGMVNELLSLGDGGVSSLSERMQIDLISYCKERINEYKFLYPSKRHSFRTDPDHLVQLYVEMDPHLLQLLLNAVYFFADKHTSERQTIQLVVGLEPSSNNVVLKVIDGGIGIDPEVLPHLFDSPTTTNTINWSNWNSCLFSAKVLLTKMGGTIQVESSLQNGTQFTIHLPSTISIIENATALSENDRSYSVVELKDRKSFSIMIVEENPDFVVLLQSQLKEVGHCFVCSTTQEALRYLEKKALPDLIIGEISSNSSENFFLLNQVKTTEAYRSIPFVVYSKSELEKDKERAMEMGAAAYLQKPASAEFLLWTVRNILERTATRIHSPLIELQSKVALNADERTWLVGVDRLVDQHLSDPAFSVDFLVDKLEIGRTVFYRKIQALTGMTPNAYIKEVRLQKAMKLIKDSSPSPTIKDLAHAVGIRDVRYFSRLFKARFSKDLSSFLNS